MFKKVKIAFSAIDSFMSVKKAYKNDFKKAPRPIIMHFETTYRCTCKCVFCNRWSEGPKRFKQELSYDEIISLIDQAYDLGVRMIYLSGGEPLLKKDILKAMLYARNKGIETSATHNGTLINEKNVHEVLAAFNSINISLDSLDRKTHDEIRGVKGTFDKAMRSIRLLKKYSKNTIINVQSVLTSENIHDISEINKKFSKMGVYTSFQPIHDKLDNNFIVREKRFKNFDLANLRDDYAAIINGYIYPNFARKFIFKKYYDKAAEYIIDPNSTKGCFNCLAGSLNFFVNPYGEVYPCDPLRKSMGNIRKKSLKDIWYDKKNNALRREIKNRKCNCWLLCESLAFVNLKRFIK